MTTAASRRSRASSTGPRKASTRTPSTDGRATNETGAGHEQNEYAVEATGLAKAFGDTRAVDGFDLALPVGGVVGLLRPNGAGRTTTVRMLATLLRPDGGSARVFGHDVVFSFP